MSEQHNASNMTLPHGGSLRGRLFWATLVSMALVLLLSSLAQAALFRVHIASQFEASLAQQLEKILSVLEFDADGWPTLTPAPQFDTLMEQPGSGWYWQLDALPMTGALPINLVRSSSLQRHILVLPPDAAASPDTIMTSHAQGPRGERLRVLQRIITDPVSPDRRYQLVIAGDLTWVQGATTHFAHTLALIQLSLLLLFALAAWTLISYGLKPLNALRQGLQRVRQGDTPQLAGHFPREIQPLVNDFNQVLNVNATAVERAHTVAGNLAHALKTPLTVLENETSLTQNRHVPFTQGIIKEQLAQIRHHIDWHLTRARTTAAQRFVAQRADVNATLKKLLQALHRVFAHKKVEVVLRPPASRLWFAGEEYDLLEMLGNLLENAFKWTQDKVIITVSLVENDTDQLLICIEDNGPGIACSGLDSVTQRGVRLDNTTPGSGLGLAIVQDLVQLYGGTLTLENRPCHHRGLSVSITLPKHKK